MIRKATLDDLDAIESAYNEHFQYEMEHGAFTVFQKGVYPTRNDAQAAIQSGTLYVYEENCEIAGSIIVDHLQPAPYTDIPWSASLRQQEVMVIHLLMVRPSKSGKGIASSLIQYTFQLAKSHSCRAVRLDTGAQNTPAVSLYQKLGFHIVASSAMKVGNVIEHSRHLFLEKQL